MVHDTLSRCARYASLHARFTQAFAYLEQFSTGTPEGRYEIDGDNLFAMVQSYETQPAEQKKFETHRRYIDIQYVFAGTETIGFIDRGKLTPTTDYDVEKDLVFYAAPATASASVLQTGEFVIYFPEDAHRGGCDAGTTSLVRKVVLKIAV